MNDVAFQNEFTALARKRFPDGRYFALVVTGADGSTESLVNGPAPLAAEHVERFIECLEGAARLRKGAA
jgi:hypothetical protein